MPMFARSSESQLVTSDPELQILFREVVKIIDCTVLEGYRNKEKQEKEFSEGDSTLHYPFGKHNKIPSNAVDVAPYPIDWNNINRFYWFAGFVMGVAARLKAEGRMTRSVRYGGDWNRNYDITDEKGLRDLVHFELV